MVDENTKTAKKSKSKLPKKIGLYKPTQIIGHGAMGNVFLCFDESLNRMVVVKQMVPSLYNQNDFIERFFREAKILSKLNHPAIVHPYSLWQESDGNLSLAMEFVHGKSLRHLLDHFPKPPVWVMLEILYQVSSALAEAHRHKIVHRDIKPANIMLDKNGRVRLLDFGVAQAQDDEDLTIENSQLGTVSYMSPEQIKDSKNITQVSDIFSLGIIAAEMLLGENPYRGSSVAETFENIQKKKPNLKNVQAPAEFLKIINQQLEKNPKKRPLATDLAESFSRLMQKYPRDLTPYMVEWANAALNDSKDFFAPQIYKDEQKFTFKNGFILGLILALILFLTFYFVM